MVATKIFSTLFFLGAAASLAKFSSSAQESQQPASNSVVARAPYSAFKEIHVDQQCRLLPYPALQSDVKKKPHLRKDSTICHLEAIASSEHMEETIVGNEMRRNWISITEQEYVLQNVTAETRQFVVEQFVPQGWQVDSDPQPTEIAGTMALFRVNAEPGEIVRLHVGLHHAKPLHTKLLKDGPSLP
ncbi:MAG: hypothetical protein ABSE51_19570 [Terracidiphilus sp.]